jgi:hypothetical protein
MVTMLAPVIMVTLVKLATTGCLISAVTVFALVVIPYLGYRDCFRYNGKGLVVPE